MHDSMTITLTEEQRELVYRAVAGSMESLCKFSTNFLDHDTYAAYNALVRKYSSLKSMFYRDSVSNHTHSTEKCV